VRNLHAHKNNTKDILQAIKGWYSVTTDITPKKILKRHKNKHEMIVHLNHLLFGYVYTKVAAFQSDKQTTIIIGTVRIQQGLCNGPVSVRLSAPAIDRCSSVRLVCCCGPGAQQQQRRSTLGNPAITLIRVLVIFVTLLLLTMFPILLTFIQNVVKLADIKHFSDKHGLRKTSADTGVRRGAVGGVA